MTAHETMSEYLRRVKEAGIPVQLDDVVDPQTTAQGKEVMEIWSAVSNPRHVFNSVDRFDLEGKLGISTRLERDYSHHELMNLAGERILVDGAWYTCSSVSTAAINVMTWLKGESILVTCEEAGR